MARALTEERAASHGITPTSGHNSGFPSHDEIRLAVNQQLSWNLKRKQLNEEIGAFRKGLRLKGFNLGKLDDKVRQLEWTPEQQKKAHEESVWYAEAMRFPVGTQLEFFGTEATPEPVREQLRWKNMGHTHGLAGKGWPDQPPEGCGPDCSKSYGEGWEEGSAIVRRAAASALAAGGVPTSGDQSEAADAGDAEPEADSAGDAPADATAPKSGKGAKDKALVH